MNTRAWRNRLVGSNSWCPSSQVTREQQSASKNKWKAKPVNLESKTNCKEHQRKVEKKIDKIVQGFFSRSALRLAAGDGAASDLRLSCCDGDGSVRSRVGESAPAATNAASERRFGVGAGSTPSSPSSPSPSSLLATLCVGIGADSSDVFCSAYVLAMLA